MLGLVALSAFCENDDARSVCVAGTVRLMLRTDLWERSQFALPAGTVCQKEGERVAFAWTLGL